MELDYGLWLSNKELPNNRYLLHVKLPRYNVPLKVREELLERIENVISEHNFDRQNFLIKVTSYIDTAEQSSPQEQIAEQFNVSSRTVSRWENGNNMPDLDILIEMSDYYEVDLREILNGERKSGNMDKEIKETVLQAVDYTNTEAEKYNKRVRICNAIALLLVAAYTLLKDSEIYMDNAIIRNGLDFAQGLAIGMMLVGLIMSSRYGAKVREFKQRVFKKSKM